MSRRIISFLQSASARLAATYLAIIMLMSIGFSIVFYNTSLHALRRQVPPNDAAFHNTITMQSGNLQQPTVQVRDFLNERAKEGRRDLLMRLIVLNTTALIAGGGLSYYLARRSLRPIEQAMEAQSQFVSDASHELRTPLTAIQTSNEVALRNKKLTLSDAKTVIRENTEETVKLKQLSDGLLNLAKQDQTPKKLTNVSVQAATQEAINQVLPLAQTKNTPIEDTTGKLTVLGDQQVLTQILVILLDNAIKYSPSGAHITVSTVVKGSSVYLNVTDSGIGIRASDMAHLFRRFYRADSARTSGAAHGYGLGLAIAKSLAESYGASITAQSELGKGSTFTIKVRLVTP